MYFDKSLGKAIWVKVTNGAATTGNITITVNGAAINIGVNASATPAPVGDTIRSRASVFNGGTLGGTDATVTFTKVIGGVASSPVFVDTGSTGAAGSFAITTAGANPVWADATGATV
ncbi:hypothetical protein ACE8FZ_03950 [Peribacillus frigoritolerans]|uniref:hypothetical protein n=1 Tax=Peribacillus frigoritolerans TaxID=450367 RepID=UPI0035CFE204